METETEDVVKLLPTVPSNRNTVAQKDSTHVLTEGKNDSSEATVEDELISNVNITCNTLRTRLRRLSVPHAARVTHNLLICE